MHSPVLCGVIPSFPPPGLFLSASVLGSGVSIWFSILFLSFVFFIPSVLGMSVLVFWWTLAVTLPFLAFPLAILISFCSLFLLVSSILSLMLAALSLLLAKAVLSVVFCSMLPSLCRVSTIFSSQMQQRLM